MQVRASLGGEKAQLLAELVHFFFNKKVILMLSKINVDMIKSKRSHESSYSRFSAEKAVQ